jgi:15-cis-phytoene synthase
VTDGAADDLDELIRRVDPDRWLTSRFIGDVAARTDVIALYAYDHELARARRVASNPLMAEIRLTWWREALDEIFEDGPVRRHPTAEALAAAIRRRGLPRAPLEAMIDGQIDALEAPPLVGAAAVAWAAAVEGSVAEAAAMILDPDAPAEAASPAGRAWGLALLLRAGLTPRETLAEPLRAALAEARAAATSLGVAALPAALPARLARFQLAGRQPGPLAQRIALVLASATGRL